MSFSNSSSNMNTQVGNIYRASNVDFSKFTFSEPVTNKHGGRSSRVKYAGQDFYFQTPRMRLPYGLGKWVDTKNPENIKYSIDFSLAGYNKNKPDEYNERIGEFYEFLNGLQTSMIEAGVKNAISWYGKPSDKVQASIQNDPDTYVRDIVKFAKDKVTKQTTDKYPPTFKARVVTWENKFIIKAYDDAGQEIKDFETAFAKGTEALAIIKLKAVTFQGKIAGISFDIVQLKLYRPAGIPDYAFVEDEQDKQPLRKTALNEEEDEEEVEEKKTYSNTVEDSDEDEEEETAKDELDEEPEEESEEEELPPPPKKKTVTKKVAESTATKVTRKAK
jgi:hypothetical protein